MNFQPPDHEDPRDDDERMQDAEGRPTRQQAIDWLGEAQRSTPYGVDQALHIARRAHEAAASLPTFQARVQPWLMECFGPMIAGDREERNHRFLEEALELVQACGCTAHEAHQLVDYVFGRPVGERGQEVGGTMVTLAALCLAQHLDMHAEAERELARINTPETTAKIRAKQAAKPKHSPLAEATAPAGGVMDDSTPGQWFVRKRIVDGEVVDCFVAAPDCQGHAYDAEILGDDEYRGTVEDENAGIKRKLADCELIVKAVTQYRAALTTAARAAEPVAEVYRLHYGGRMRNIGTNAIRQLVPSDKLPPPGTKLYAASPTPPTGKCTCVYATAKNTPAVRQGYEMGGYVKAEDPQCPIHGKATLLGSTTLPIPATAGAAQGAEPHSWKEEQARFFGISADEVPASPQPPTGTEKK